MRQRYAALRGTSILKSGAASLILIILTRCRSTYHDHTYQVRRSTYYDGAHARCHPTYYDHAYQVPRLYLLCYTYQVSIDLL